MINGNILVSYGLVPGVICCSSASGIHGMSRCSDFKYSMFAEGIDSTINSVNMRIIPVKTLADLDTQQVGKRTVTTPFQTIMDMVQYECDLEFTCDALLWWEAKYGSLDEIEEGLKARGLYGCYKEEYYPALVDQGYSQFQRKR